MAKPSSRNSDRSGGRSIFTGVLIGLIVGAVLAVGVALWVTGNNPFKSAPPASAPSPAAPATPETPPSLEFYKILPSDAPSELPPAPDATAKPTLYYLQAGAFQNADDADNLKAQLAMLGVEAVIQTGEVADKGVFHRVRVGPFRALDEVNRTRSLLTQNDIPATLVKELPTPQETP
ncbi:MAG TPA: SPOR domain-containing protein [Thiobacillus sp.]|nr:SPOR domain-containing protein [Thiobacillus sp.]